MLSELKISYLKRIPDHVGSNNVVNKKIKKIKNKYMYILFINELAGSHSGYSRL